MLKRVLGGLGIVCSLVLGCSGNPGDPTGPNTGEENELGEVSIPLTAQTPDTLYRLVNAKFTITGATLNKKVLSVNAPPDEAVHTETLPVGSYSVLLEDGWQL